MLTGLKLPWEMMVIWKSLGDVAPLLMLIGIGVVLRITRIVDDDSRMVLTRVG